MNKNLSSFMNHSSWAALGFYSLIGFEFLYMASPFAAYFYSVYSPALDFLDNYPGVAWMTGFFLPHLVEDTRSSFINILPITGAFIAAAGFVVFFVCAVQVYYAKLFKKGIVSGGLYRWIRHPQYTAFAFCSFGLLILWPRYLVLIMFISLLFVYYLLARAEENECARKFGDSYLKYKKSTFMFFPVKITFIKYIPAKRWQRISMLSGLFIIVIISAVQIADFFKQKSIDALYLKYHDETGIFLSVFEKNDRQFSQIIDLVNPTNIHYSKSANYEQESFINYILPEDMYISEIPMYKPEDAPNHIFSHQYSVQNLKVIVTKAKLKEEIENQDYKSILLNALSLNPIAEIHIDLFKMKISETRPLTQKNIRYKNIPEPIF